MKYCVGLDPSFCVSDWDYQKGSSQDVEMMESLEAKDQEKQTRDLRNLVLGAAEQGFSLGM